MQTLSVSIYGMNFLRVISAIVILVLEFKTGTSNPSYLLAGNKTNYCYEEPYISKRAECLEPLISLYYGDYFPVVCPNIANSIAAQKCEGCPWSRINATGLSPPQAKALDRLKLFQPTKPSCSVAEYLEGVWLKRNLSKLSFFGFAVPLFSSMFLSMCDREGSPTTPLLFGSRIVEPLYSVLLWILFFVGYGISSAGNKIHAICEGPLSLASFLVGDWINLAIMVWTSWWRCRYLEARDRPKEAKSWAAYRGSSLYRKSAIWKQRLVDFTCWSAPCLILLSILFKKRYSIDSFSHCEIGSYRFTRYGVIQYSKLVLALAAIGVYSFGPPTSLIMFYVRYSLLIVVLLLSISLLVVMRLPLYQPQCFSTLIPHVSDCDIAGPLHAELIANSFSIALLGIAEPLRLGWPRRRKQKIRPKDVICADLTLDFEDARISDLENGNNYFFERA